MILDWFILTIFISVLEFDELSDLELVKTVHFSGDLSSPPDLSNMTRDCYSSLSKDRSLKIASEMVAINWILLLPVW